ncbi:hypothetical protein C8F01DRAFT_1363398 [Mycena amicta]|nr:hypothetical protein C8F01DRAFT_1363398 [Mycena amicta]
MNVHSVLRIQELCDMIAELLAEKDLIRLAPLSRAFAAAAHRLLLHTVCFHPGAFNDFEAWGADDEEIRSQKLAGLLRRSPALAIHVRRIRLAFEEDVLRPLHAIVFPNLREVVLHRRTLASVSHEAIILASNLLSLESIQNLALVHPHFDTPAAFGELLAKHTPRLTGLSIVHPLTAHSKSSRFCAAAPSRLVLKRLHFDADKLHDHKRLLLAPTSAIDASVLEELSLGPGVNMTADSLLYLIRNTVRKLSIHAQTKTHNPMLLTKYPRLADIVIYTHFLSDATTLLSPLADSRTPVVLRCVTVVFKSQISNEQYPDLHTLGTVFDAEWAAPARCRVHIVLPPDTRRSVAPSGSGSSDGGLALRYEIRQAFLRHEAAGKLNIGSSVQNIVT